jgi:hypothetical protein
VGVRLGHQANIPGTVNPPSNGDGLNALNGGDMPNGRDKDYYVGGWHGKDWRGHHTRKECPIGEAILEGDILQGSGGLPKCQTCINLEKEMVERRL